MIQKTTVTNFQEYNEIIGKFGEDNFIFRGVGKLEFDLISKVGREDGKLLIKEYDLFTEFKKLAYPYLKNNINFENDLEVLTIAQHHGLPTRLLDWSRNPLVATYFAVNNYVENDSALYILNSNTIPSSKEVLQEEGGSILGADIASTSDIFIYDPSHITERIIAQQGLFTYHNEPNTSMISYVHSNNETLLEIERSIQENGMQETVLKFKNRNIDIYSEKNEIKLHKVVIKSNFKEKLLTILNQYGINRSGLFPGLDGISAHLNWKYFR